jgi:hypothetical protein
MHTTTSKNIKTNNNQTASPAGELTTASAQTQTQIQTPILQSAAAARRLHKFINPAELEVIDNAVRGEEGEFFKNKLVELAGIVDNMPVTYQTDGQGDQAMAWLHYFTPGGDFYITERDQEEEQLQAFGLACIWEEELGYINIIELIEAGAELDLYWTPQTLGQVKAERLMSDVNYTGHSMHY